MNTQITQYIKENEELIYRTLKELCHIPAPSGFELERAQYCKRWLESCGAQGVYIDEALNAVFPINCEGSERITVFAAHTDTVFPDREPMPYHDDGEKIFCPGVADDTASIVSLLLTAKFFLENNIVPQQGFVFLFNSCEEGLGNLKGTRKFFRDHADRVSAFVTLDSSLNIIVDRAVGSHRYEVTVLTEGGHSFNKFGNQNAIAEISRIVSDIYKIQVPQKPGTKTTYNVGTVQGGTSVNTIAQSATILCEYRSDDKECMEDMQREFQRIFAAAAQRATVQVTMVGDRPCSSADPKKVQALTDRLAPIIEDAIGEKILYHSGSTDCNIPLSLGIPALCIGTDIHDKTHTREEWVDKASLKTGLLIAIKTALEMGDVTL